MTTIPLIQYVERFQTQQLADEACAALSNLLGCVGTRVVNKHDMEDTYRPWVAQALFGYEPDANHESISSCYGMRVVQCPISFLQQFKRS